MPRPPIARRAAQRAALDQMAAEFGSRGAVASTGWSTGQPPAAPGHGARHAGAVRGRDGRPGLVRRAHGRGWRWCPSRCGGLLGAIVSFYFGARHQVKGQEFQRSIDRQHGARAAGGRQRSRLRRTARRQPRRGRTGPMPGSRSRPRRAEPRWRIGALARHATPRDKVIAGGADSPLAPRRPAPYTVGHDYRAWPFRPRPRLPRRLFSGGRPAHRGAQALARLDGVAEPAATRSSC